MIFETHAHYNDEAFDEDREELIKDFREKNIEGVINIGADMKSSRETCKYVEKYENFYGAVGVHPNDVDKLTNAALEELRQMAQKEKIVAIGEIGLDYYYDEPEKSVQKKWFMAQALVAKEEKLPIIIHSREAAKDTLEIMREFKAEEIGGVVHCFSYTKETAREILDMDFYFGIGGVVTFKNAKKLKEAVEYIPIDKILLETDCPYLAPEPFRGTRNSSLNIPYIGQAIAEIKKISYDEVVEITNQNAKKLFNIKNYYEI